MRGYFLIVLAAATGCDNSSPTPSSSPSPSATSPAAAPTVSVGADIVAATSPVAFSQGQVVAVTTEEVTFEFGRPDPSTRKRPQKKVPAADVYPIGAKHDLAEGDPAVCSVVKRQTEITPIPAWYPCRVLSLAGNQVKVEDHYGNKYQLDPERVVQPRPETRAAILTFIEKELAHRAFDHAFEAAGQPYRPAGWVPAPDAPVVIHFVGTSFYGGKVVDVKADKGKVRVHFDGTRWNDRDVALTEVAPLPQAAQALPTRVDQFVLVRPKEADERWEHQRVKRIDGDMVEVENRSGTVTKVPAQDLLPIVSAS